MLKAYINLILESKFDDAKVKFPEFKKEISELQSSIPVKYLQWSIKQLNSGFDVNELISIVKFFDKNVSKFNLINHLMI